jgi:hypothetical protein
MSRYPNPQLEASLSGANNTTEMRALIFADEELRVHLATEALTSY